jgi:hypothetical protein
MDKTRSIAESKSKLKELVQSRSCFPGIVLSVLRFDAFEQANTRTSASLLPDHISNRPSAVSVAQQDGIQSRTRYHSLRRRRPLPLEKPLSNSEQVRVGIRLVLSDGEDRIQGS